MYQTYRDIAAFRIVYIKEAHPTDSRRPAGYAVEKGIAQPRDYSERCSVAHMFLKDEKLTIPCVIDDMDNSVNRAYKAWPTRAFVVRKDGRLAVAGRRGPRGLAPALKAARKWLEAYKKTGREPDLPEP